MFEIAVWRSSLNSREERKNTSYFTLITNLRKKSDSLIVNVSEPGIDTYSQKLSHPHLPSITTTWHNHMRKMLMRQIHKVSGRKSV